MLADPDQWARCVHTGTALLPSGGVELDWVDDDVDSCTPDLAGGEPAGLAFDRWCLAYRSDPCLGLVEALTVGKPPVRRCPGVWKRPGGLAVDHRQRLYVAETGDRSVAVVDLGVGRQIGRVAVGPGRPVDLAADCTRVLALVRRPDDLVILEGRRRPRPGPRLVRPRCHQGLHPARVTSGPLVLWTGHGYGVVARPDGTVELDIDGATDLELNPAGVLVIARAPGLPFRRFARDAAVWRELEPLNAPGYDGGAITVNPSGRVVFTTATGYASTAGSAAQHLTSGQVVTYRLDSGVYRTRWGRMFVDACIPAGTSVRARFLTTDLDDVTDPVDPSPAARAIGRPPHPEDTPPLPSSSLLDQDETTWSLFRRPNGREEPWKQISADDPLETYEVPVHALPGRYLWIVLELTGTELVTPRVGALRVERPGHGLLGSLPRGWSRDDGDADFTQRYLAPLDGLLHELDTKEALRAILLDPRSTPQETLPWLASFAGLILDRRWPETARRTLVAEAYTLFSRRGTKVALLRLLAIYLGRTPSIVEAWQLRGLGGTILGLQPGGTPPPAIGGGSSATAMLGRFTIGGQVESTDSYQESAHRFTVLVPGELTSEQRDVVTGLLRSHRPAHTTCGICELGAGMRVGERLRVSLTSFVGPGTGWAAAVVGHSRLGDDGVVGIATDGARVGESRVGTVVVR